MESDQAACGFCTGLTKMRRKAPAAQLILNLYDNCRRRPVDAPPDCERQAGSTTLGSDVEKRNDTGASKSERVSANGATIARWQLFPEVWSSLGRPP